MTPFCDRCGLCCKLIAKIPQLAAFDRGDGVCIHLKDNLCEIYDSRPEICNVEKMFSLYSESMTRVDYYCLVSASCKYLKEHFEELSQQFRLSDSKEYSFSNHQNKAMSKVIKSASGFGENPGCKRQRNSFPSLFQNLQVVKRLLTQGSETKS